MPGFPVDGHIYIYCFICLSIYIFTIGIQRTSDCSPCHDVRVHMSAIRRPKKVEDVVIIAARVKAILSIIKKP